MGKDNDFRYSSRVRYGQLSKEERKVIEKTPGRDVMGASFENTHICNEEIAAMLQCFKDNNWGTERCVPQIEVRRAVAGRRGRGSLRLLILDTAPPPQTPAQGMYACVDVHQYDPDPKVLAKKWQVGLKREVFALFAQRRLAGRR